MIFVQKLPTLEPEMRGALRSHIMRKRQRLKQELEQDAIEKRIKKEKELKQLQDAMTLDQIKEQLANLEKKLENLRDEKHHLFVQLKQVLNEDNTRRKHQEFVSSDQRKVSVGSVEANPSQRSSQTGSNNIPILQTSTFKHHSKPVTPSISTRIQDLASTLVTNTKLVSPQTTNNLTQRTHTHLLHSSHSPNPYVGAHVLPIPPTYSLPDSLAQRQAINHKLQLAGPIPSELIASSSLDFGQYRIPTHLSGHRPFLMDIPSFNVTQNHHDMKLLASFNHGKRSMSVANLSDTQLLDERSLTRKKPNSFMYPSTNRILSNGMPTAIPNLSHYYQLNQLSPLHQPVSFGGNVGLPPLVPSSAVSNMTNQNSFNPRKPALPHLISNSEYMLNQSKPGIIIPGLNSFYSTPPPIIPQSLYTNDNDLKHSFSSPYSKPTQQYSNSSRHNNPHFQQPEHNSRYIATSTSYHPQQKNPYQPNK